MTPQQYERLTQLFHAALEIAPDEREIFLEHVSESDAELRGELESLLSAEAAALTRKPPDDIAAGYLAQQGDEDGSVAALAPNIRLAHYEIRSLLGKGGMGEVYLAEDLRLHRKVALKILPASVAANQDRMRRFEQEAQAAAALNHPNIAHIYEIGESEGTHFIAIEYIDGETLRDKIHRDKAPLQELLKYLTQVAEGLSKAHAAGIVHRDLKPDNIMITDDDYAKILDFGLAKLVEHKAVDSISVAATAARTAIKAHHSLPGMVLGTAGYMSPEQAQGQVNEIDHRSDIFSFGCILFEAVTGQRPFADESVLESLHKVVYESAPPISDLNPSAPPNLQGVIRRCLVKDREDRYQTIKEVALELKEVRQSMETAAELDTGDGSSNRARILSGQTAPQAATRTLDAQRLPGNIRQHRKSAVIVATVGMIAIGAFVWLLPRTRQRRMVFTNPVTLKRLTPDIYATDSTLSSDGVYLAYVKQGKAASAIWLREMAGGNAVQIMPPSAEGYGSLQFSPDTKQVYYMTNRAGWPNGTIARVPISGGSPQYIARNVFGNFAVSPNGKHLAFVRSSTVVIANADGNAERDLFTQSSSVERFVTWGSQLAWSPDGTRIAVCGVRNVEGRGHAELFEISVSDGARRSLRTPDWNAIEDAAWLADGASLLVTARETEGDPFQIWRVSYPNGETARVTNDSNSYQGLSLTADSRTLVAEQYFSRQNIWLGSLSDIKSAQQLTSSTVAADGYAGIAFAPNDTIIFTSPRTGNVDLWSMGEDGNNQSQLTANSGSLNISPQVTRDGRYIVFASSRSGSRHIWRMDINGQNAVQLTDGPSYEDTPQLSPDGQWIYYSTVIDERPAVMKISIAGSSASRVSPGDVTTWSVMPSPDGKLLASAVYIDKSDSPWKYAITSSEDGAQLKLLDTKMHRARWSNDSKAIIYIKRGTAELWRQPIDGRQPPRLFTLSPDRLYNFAISRDFKKIAYSLGNESSEAVLINNFAND